MIIGNKDSTCQTLVNEEVIKCIFCSETDTEKLPYQPEDFEYFVKPVRNFLFYNCNSYNTRFIYPRPTISEVISFYPNYWAYNKKKSFFLLKLLAIRAEFRAKYLSRLLNQKNEIFYFDVGTGDCSNFDLMKKYGKFIFYGVEINPDIVNIAKSKGYNNVMCGTFESLDISHLEGKFDVVSMYHVIEHAIDPLIMLKKAATLLRPGGIILGQNPFMTGIGYTLFRKYWSGYHFPRHLNLPSLTVFQKCFSDIGVANIKFTGAISLQPALSLQNYITRKFSLFRNMKYGKSVIFNILFILSIPIMIICVGLNLSSVKSFKGNLNKFEGLT